MLLLSAVSPGWRTPAATCMLRLPCRLGSACCSTRCFCCTPRCCCRSCCIGRRSPPLPGPHTPSGWRHLWMCWGTAWWVQALGSAVFSIMHMVERCFTRSMPWRQGTHYHCCCCHSARECHRPHCGSPRCPALCLPVQVRKEHVCSPSKAGKVTSPRAVYVPGHT